MNRIIKFRVWDVENARWLQQLNLSGFDGRICSIDGIDSYFTPFTDHLCCYKDSTKFIIQENTGALDKNGKRIFEGDLVNFYTLGAAHGPHREDYKNEEVWYFEDDACYFFGKLYYDGWHGFNKTDIKDIEVMGNIFENPEETKKL